MEYKFLNPETIFKGILTSFKGNFNEMWVPNDESKKEEKYCYISFNNEQEIIKFVTHFDIVVLELEHPEEYPTNKANGESGRMKKFTKIST